MGEVDHSAQVEDQRQADGHQRIERANDQPVENVKNN
jgi:hypothetical protein